MRTQSAFCGRTNRRRLLSDLGWLGGIALGSLLLSDGVTRHRNENDAERLIRLANQVSCKERHLGFFRRREPLETFDPKPLLNQFAGKTYDDTHLPNPQKPADLSGAIAERGRVRS